MASQTTNGTFISFLGTIDGQFALTISTTGGIVFDNNIGSVTPLSSLNVTSSDATLFNNLNGASIATTGTQSYSAALQLMANAVFSSTNGNLAFGSTVDSDVAASSEASLTLTAGGTTSFDAAVGGASTSPDLTGVIVTKGATLVGGGAVSSSGTQSYTGPVLLAANTVFSSIDTGASGNITFGGTIDSTGGAFSLTASTSAATTLFGGLVGSQGPLQTLTISNEGTTVLNIVTSGSSQSITTLGTQSYTSTVILQSTAALDVTTAGSVSFSSTVDAATAGVQGLSITDMGQPSFNLGLGQNAALASLAVTTSQDFAVDVPITTVGALSLSAGVLGTSGTLPSSVTGSLAVLGTLTSTTGNITLAAAQYVVEPLGFTIPMGTLNLQPNMKAGTGSAVLFLSSLMKATAINVTGTGTSGNNLLTINSTIPPAQIIQLVQDPNFTTDPTGLPSIINSTPAVASANLTTVDLARHTIAGLTAEWPDHQLPERAKPGRIGRRQ